MLRPAIGHHADSKSGTCGNCVDYKAEAGEIRDGERAARLETATWSPVLGFVIKDREAIQ